MSEEKAQFAPSTRAYVAGKVRGFLAERQISVNQVNVRLGRESSSYWYRRLTKMDTPLSVDDLADLASLLDVEVIEFFGALPQGTGPRNSPRRRRAYQPTAPYLGQLLLLPHLDGDDSDDLAHPSAA